ncbi:MAG: Crp/Fnr family transcriptional regulator [Eubacterium sp.]|nr:Crp/Fnr family transcriptional regulator [Eubacterium sp.]
MKEVYLEEVLPFLKRIDKERREQFQDYFKNAPLWILENFVIEKLQKGTTFIREGEPVDMVYFIGDGTIKATDHRIYGISFDFMLFTKVYAYGGMEIIMDIDRYTTTLQTVTDCTVVKIPKAQFAKWMSTDIISLKYEAKLMGEYMLEQARNVRAFLFLQGANRLAMLFTNRYEKYAVGGCLKLCNDRQELSDFTGLSVKTITRSVNKLKEDGLITKQGNTIVICEEQYNRLKENLMEVLSDEE